MQTMRAAVAGHRWAEWGRVGQATVPLRALDDVVEVCALFQINWQTKQQKRKQTIFVCLCVCLVCVLSVLVCVRACSCELLCFGGIYLVQ